MKNTYIIDTQDLILIGKNETIRKETKNKKISNILFKTGIPIIILFTIFALFIGFNIKITIIFSIFLFAVISFVSFTFFLFSTPYILINNYDYIIIGIKKLGGMEKIKVKILNELKFNNVISEMYQNYINQCNLSYLEYEIFITLIDENFEGTIEECIKSVKALAK